MSNDNDAFHIELEGCDESYCRAAYCFPVAVAPPVWR